MKTKFSKFISSLLVLVMILGTIPMTASAEGERSLATDKSEYTEGEPIMVTATGNETDWVGLYLKDETCDPGNGGTESIYWYYVGKANGTAFDISKGSTSASRADYASIPAGEYKVVLLADGSYTEVTKVDIVVKKSEVPPERTVATDKTEYTEGEPIMVTAKGVGTDWVGLYLKGEACDPNNGGAESIYWYNVSDSNGVAFNISKGTHNPKRADYASIPAGEYSVVLLADGGYTEITKVDIVVKKSEVPPERTVATDKTEYTEGEPIMVTAKGVGTDWVGLYLKGEKCDPDNGGAKSIYWYSVADANGVAFDISKGTFNPERADYASIPAGEYSVVLLADGSYTEITKVDIVVKKSEVPPERTVATDKTEYIEGEPIMVTAKGVGTDWVGLYLKGEKCDPDNGGAKSIYWYNVADANGVAFNISKGAFNSERADYASIPAGEYSVVLLSDGSYTEVTKVDIVVKKSEVPPERTVATDKTEYIEGEPIMVTAKGVGADWVGLYLKGEVCDPDNGGAKSIYWYSVADADGVAFDISKGKHNTERADYASIPAGEYSVVLLADGGYTEITKVDIVVKKSDKPFEYVLSTENTVYHEDEKIYITATGKGADWVGLYLKGEKYDPNNGGAVSIYWYNVTDSNGIAYDISKGNSNNRLEYEKIPAGEYTIALFANGGYEVIKSLDIIVTAHDKKETVTKEPSCTQEGEKVIACTLCSKSETVAIPKLPHNFEHTIVKEATCYEYGTELVKCKDCGYEDEGLVPIDAHYLTSENWTKNYLTQKATLTKNGVISTKCNICGNTVKTTPIYSPKTVKLSKTAYTYNAKVQTPAVTVKDSKGKTLKKGTDYTVTYAKGRKNVGKYAVKITFRGNYSGSKTLYFTIIPKGTSVSKVSAGKKKFTVKWKKQATQTTGYQVQYSTDKKFKKGNKTVTVKGAKSTSKSVSKLKGKKKYYVRVRTYKTVNGKKYYSSWSKVKSVTTKK